MCGTSVEGVQLDWFFSNGTKVGSTNRNVRVGHFPNGTVSLQIASDRRLSPCDSGVYTCRANLSESNQAQEKTYTVFINSKSRGRQKGELRGGEEEREGEGIERRGGWIGEGIEV